MTRHLSYYAHMLQTWALCSAVDIWCAWFLAVSTWMTQRCVWIVICWAFTL